MILLSSILVLAMTTAEAIKTVLNSPASTSVANYERAKAMVRQGAEKGEPLQQFICGVTTDDRDLAKRYLEVSYPKIRAMAEKTNNPLAWYLLSMESNDLMLLKKAAAGGNPQALNALGTIAIQKLFEKKEVNTNSLERILHTSYECFQRAVAKEKNDSNGYINLGTCYMRGLGCKTDLAMAFQSFKRAAELGNPEGMDYVSACYEHGHGIQKDLEKSLYWRMRAKALRGDKHAEEWLKARK